MKAPLVLLTTSIVFFTIHFVSVTGGGGCIRCSCRNASCEISAPCRGSLCGSFKLRKIKWVETPTISEDFDDDLMGPEFDKRLETLCTECSCEQVPCQTRTKCEGDVCGTLKKYDPETSGRPATETKKQGAKQDRCMKCSCSLSPDCEVSLNCNGTLCGSLKRKDVHAIVNKDSSDFRNESGSTEELGRKQESNEYKGSSIPGFNFDTVNYPDKTQLNSGSRKKFGKDQENNQSKGSSVPGFFFDTVNYPDRTQPDPGSQEPRFDYDTVFFPDRLHQRSDAGIPRNGRRERDEKNDKTTGRTNTEIKHVFGISDHDEDKNKDTDGTDFDVDSVLFPDMHKHNSGWYSSSHNYEYSETTRTVQNGRNTVRTSQYRRHGGYGPGNYTPRQTIQQFPLDGKCLRCLCHAVSSCNLNSGCSLLTCGPFGLSRTDWEMAKPFNVDGHTIQDSDFEYCATNYICAKEVVRSYLQKSTKDCNNDGRIDCQDYSFHYVTHGECQRVPDPEYYARLSNCHRGL